MRRQSMLWAVAALLGIVVAAAITWATSHLTSQHIGLASESVSEINRLAPAVSGPPATTTSRTATATETQTETRTVTRTETVTTPSTRTTATVTTVTATAPPLTTATTTTPARTTTVTSTTAHTRTTRRHQTGQPGDDSSPRSHPASSGSRDD